MPLEGIMQVKRESFFRCTLTSGDAHVVFHIRAWDRNEALQLFQTELAADGIPERGTLDVVRLGEPREPARPVVA